MEVAAKPQLSRFYREVVDAIENDRFLVAIVTSDTQAKYQNEGTAFGAGKTTIALQIAHRFNYYSTERHDFLDFGASSRDNPASWNVIFGGWTEETTTEPTNCLWYYPYEINRRLRQNNREKKITQAGVWDAVQASAPAKQGSSDALVNLAGMLSEERPSIRFLILTAPNINSIASPIAKLVKYELIVFERGLYEVQKVIHRKDFKNPRRDRMRLKPIEGLDKETAEARGLNIDDYRVPPLHPAVKDRYEAWRRWEKEFRFQGLDAQLLKHDQLIVKEEKPPVNYQQRGAELARLRWGKKT